MCDPRVCLGYGIAGGGGHLRFDEVMHDCRSGAQRRVVVRQTEPVELDNLKLLAQRFDRLGLPKLPRRASGRRAADMVDQCLHTIGHLAVCGLDKQQLARRDTRQFVRQLIDGKRRDVKRTGAQLRPGNGGVLAGFGLIVHVASRIKVPRP